MPLILPIKDLRNTSEISVLAHEKQEPIFITKNGYSDLVVMSAELYDRFAKNNRIDQTIYEAEEDCKAYATNSGDVIGRMMPIWIQDIAVKSIVGLI